MALVMQRGRRGSKIVQNRATSFIENPLGFCHISSNLKYHGYVFLYPSNPEPGPSGGVKPSLKRLLSEEGNDATTATPEKTRKIDDVTKTTIINADDVTKTTIKHEDDVFELSTDVEDDSKSQSLVGTPIDDNSVLILDDSIVRYL